jgi:phosphinothricin acetyltransferase
VYRGVGFKLGRWCDVGWWHRSLLARHGSPEPPLDLAAVSTHPDWEALVRRGEKVVRAEAARNGL